MIVRISQESFANSGKCLLRCRHGVKLFSSDLDKLAYFNLRLNNFRIWIENVANIWTSLDSNNSALVSTVVAICNRNGLVMNQNKLRKNYDSLALKFLVQKMKRWQRKFGSKFTIQVFKTFSTTNASDAVSRTGMPLFFNLIVEIILSDFTSNIIFRGLAGAIKLLLL